MTNLPQGCQYPLTPCYKFTRGLAKTYGIFARGLPQLNTKGQAFKLCAIPLKKVKFKVKNQEAINSYKNYQRVISKIRLYPSIPASAHLNAVRQFL